MLSQQRLAVWCFASCLVTTVSCLVFTFGHAWSQRYLFGIHVWSCLVTTLAVWCSSLDRREHHCYAIWCSRLVSSIWSCLVTTLVVWCSSLDRREHHCYAIWCSRLVSSIWSCLVTTLSVWNSRLVMLGYNVSCLVFQFGQEGTPLLCHLVFSFGQLRSLFSCLVFSLISTRHYCLAVWFPVWSAHVTI